MKSQKTKDKIFYKKIKPDDLLIGHLYKISRENHDRLNLSYNFSSRKIIEYGNHLMLEEVNVRIINDETSEGYFIFLGKIEEKNCFDPKKIAKIFGMEGFCYENLKGMESDYTIYGME